MPLATEPLQVAHMVSIFVAAEPPQIRMQLLDEDGQIFAGAALGPAAARLLAATLIRAADAVAQPGTSGAVN